MLESMGKKRLYDSHDIDRYNREEIWRVTNPEDAIVMYLAIERKIKQLTLTILKNKLSAEDSSSFDFEIAMPHQHSIKIQSSIPDFLTRIEKRQSQQVFMRKQRN